MQMISYKDLRPKARALVTVPLTQTSAPELTSVDLMDLHCPAPDCPCTLSILRVVQFTSKRGSDSRPWRSATATVRLQVDHRTGEVQKVEGEVPLAGWIAAYLDQDRKWLAKLRKRASEVAEWKRPDAWRSKDWSDLELASMVAYHRIRPTEPAIAFSYGIHEYTCAEWYCWNPACDCTEMLLLFMDAEGAVQGMVRIDRAARRITDVEEARIPEPKLRDLTNHFMKNYPDAFALFHKRAQFMSQEFGAIVRPQEMPIRVGGKVGRNDPCPCGSGKKHKKCCL